jgi:WD40 repeat protein
LATTSAVPVPESARFLGHTACVNSLCFPSKGTVLVSGSSDNTVRVWDFSTRKCLHQLKDFSSPVWGVALSPDGALMAAASNADFLYEKKKLYRNPTSDRSKVKIFLARTAKHLKSLRAEDPIYRVVFSPDGKVLVGSGDNGLICTWDTATWRKLSQVTIGGGRAYGLAFSPNGRSLALANLDGSVYLCSFPTFKDRRRIGSLRRVASLAFAPDGRSVAFGGLEGQVQGRECATGKLLWAVRASKSVCSVAFSPDGAWLATAENGPPGPFPGEWIGDVRLWETRTQRQVRAFTGHAGGATAVAFVPDGSALVTADYKGTINIFPLPMKK